MTNPQHIAEQLSEAQRAFIVRMEPHREEQPITLDDWDSIDPSVESGMEYPHTLWFGGMIRMFAGGDESFSFRFNETGLAVRATLQGGGDG
jgi:hypothetical protein